MNRLGMHASTVRLGAERKLAGLHLSNKLRIAADDEVWSIRRLRLADDEPIAIELVTIPVSAVPSATLADFSRESLYRMFRDKFGIHLAGGSQRMEAKLTDTEE